MTFQGEVGMWKFLMEIPWVRIDGLKSVFFLINKKRNSKIFVPGAYICNQQ